MFLRRPFPLFHPQKGKRKSSPQAKGALHTAAVRGGAVVSFSRYHTGISHFSDYDSLVLVCGIQSGMGDILITTFRLHLVSLQVHLQSCRSCAELIVLASIMPHLPLDHRSVSPNSSPIIST